MSDLSTNCKVIVDGLASPNPNFLKTESDIKFILAPKSHNAPLKKELPIVQGILKALDPSISVAIFFVRWHPFLREVNYIELPKTPFLR